MQANFCHCVIRARVDWFAALEGAAGNDILAVFHHALHADNTRVDLANPLSLSSPSASTWSSRLLLPLQRAGARDFVPWPKRTTSDVNSSGRPTGV